MKKFKHKAKQNSRKKRVYKPRKKKVNCSVCRNSVFISKRQKLPDGWGYYKNNLVCTMSCWRVAKVDELKRPYI